MGDTIEIDGISIPLINKAKYNIECPLCSLGRRKRGTKSLTVFRDPPDQNGRCWIRAQCNHGGQCEWNVRQYALESRTEALEDSMDSYTIKPVKPATEPPMFHEGNRVWWYLTNEKEVLYGIMRQNYEGGKKDFYPVTMLESGEVIRLSSWPKVKRFYNQEYMTETNDILLVEGEKAAEAAQKLFPKAACMTWRGGSASVSEGDWEALKGRKVYIWPDNDAPGKQVCNKLLPNLAQSIVYLVDVSGFPNKFDLADEADIKDVRAAIKSASIVHKPIEYFSTLDSIRESAAARSGRFLTGWDLVDENLRCPMSGMIVIEGRTGHGKSAVAVNLAKNALDQGRQVYYFSFEIPDDEVVARLIRVDEPETDIEDILRTLQQDFVDSRIIDYIKSGQLLVVDPSKRLTATKMKELLNDKKFSGSLVILDYAQKIPTQKIDMRLGLVDLMDQVELLSKEHSFLTLMLCQLTPHYPDPLLDAPAESKSVHYNADMVMRVWKSHPQWVHPIYDTLDGNFVIDIRKNRNGESDQLFGFNFDRGARLDPVSSSTAISKPPKADNKAAQALERIADSLEYFLDKGKL